MGMLWDAFALDLSFKIVRILGMQVAGAAVQARLVRAGSARGYGWSR